MARLKAFDEDRAIDSAVDCFWARGYEATSVRDLAEAMGIGGASLYNAYGDKRELFIRSLERYANRTMPRSAGWWRPIWARYAPSSNAAFWRRGRLARCTSVSTSTRRRPICWA